MLRPILRSCPVGICIRRGYFSCLTTGESQKQIVIKEELMIYITGDTHGDFKRRFNTDSFPEQKSMTKDDYLIICGDFGGIWYQETESRNEL